MTSFLTMAKAARGKVKKNRVTALHMDEVSSVDRAAQAPAIARLFKRYDGASESLVDQIEKFSRPAALTTAVDGHSHLLTLMDYEGYESTSGTTTWVETKVGDKVIGHSHPWIKDAEGKITIGEVDGHTHEISVMSKRSPATANGSSGISKEAETPGEGTMSGKAEGLTLEAQVQELQKRLDRSEKFGMLSEIEKVHFGSLKDDLAKDAFLAKSAEERIEEVKKRQRSEDDGVIYKSADGSEFRKSDDPRLVELAKSRDILSAKLAKNETELELERLQKRAEAELGHLPGTVEQRAQLLKAVEAIPDEAIRKASLEAIKAGDAAIAKSFDTFGHKNGQVIAGSAEDRLEKLQKSFQKDHPNVSSAQALNEVLKTEEGQAVYAEMEAEKAKK